MVVNTLIKMKNNAFVMPVEYVMPTAPKVVEKCEKSVRHTAH
jgi:hypothetical protein